MGLLAPHPVSWLSCFPPPLASSSPLPTATLPAGAKSAKAGEGSGLFPGTFTLVGCLLGQQERGADEEGCVTYPHCQEVSSQNCEETQSVPRSARNLGDLTHYSYSVPPGPRCPLFMPLTESLVAVTYRSICLAGPFLRPCPVPGPRGTTASVDPRCWNPSSSLHLGEVRRWAVVSSCGRGICLPFCGLASSATGFMCLWICGGRCRGPA